jgi:hypothetical protein
MRCDEAGGGERRGGDGLDEGPMGGRHNEVYREMK